MKKHYILEHQNGEKEKRELADHETFQSLAAALGLTGVVCAMEDGKPAALGEPISADTTVQLLRPNQSEHASRVFLRGATFLLHCAAAALYPQRRLLVDHVLGGGMFCRLDGVTRADVAVLSEKIETYIAEDQPFTLRRTSVEEARQVLSGEGLDEMVRLLKFRPYDFFNLYRFDGHECYFHGIMPPSAGYLKGMKLTPYNGGLLLRYPAPYRNAASIFDRQPKYAAVFARSERWAEEMGASYISDINERFLGGEIEDLIAVNEALHEKYIAEIAEMISDRPGVRTVLIAGPSSSGKTTFSRRLAVHLRVLGNQCIPISVDDYYLDRDDIPLDDSGEPDFETIDALDVKKLGDDLDTLLSGETAHMPEFDFVSGKRKDETRALRIDDELLIIEGIHGLNNALTSRVPAERKFKIFISPLTALNFDSRSTVLPEDLRLLRRLARDKRTRGSSFCETFGLWESVRTGEYKYIMPYQESADVMFNSTLLYEPLVLKKYCYEELRRIGPHEACYAQAQSLLKFLNYFYSLEDESAIPVQSILREFIGKGG